MTTTADTATRANHEGHPCPPWCVTDHDEQLFPGYFTKSHGGEDTPVDGAAHLTVRPSLAPSWTCPRVQVGGARKGSLFTEDAAELADLIEQLADATPEQHRELAAAIRKAAAAITEGAAI